MASHQHSDSGCNSFSADVRGTREKMKKKKMFTLRRHVTEGTSICQTEIKSSSSAECYISITFNMQKP